MNKHACRDNQCLLPYVELNGYEGSMCGISNLYCPGLGETISNCVSSKLSRVSSDDLGLAKVTLPFGIDDGPITDTGVWIGSVDALEESVEEDGAGLRRIEFIRAGCACVRSSPFKF